MKLVIQNVIDNGTHASERVVISVLEDAELHFYIVRDTTYTDDHHISNKWQHAYIFTNQLVKKGDEVILYTKKGTKEVKDLAGDKKQYIYYWGLDSSVWNNDGDAAVLYQIEDWKTFKVKSTAQR